MASSNVDARAATTSEAVLSLPTCGRLTGSVRRAGRGVPDVVLLFSSTPQAAICFQAMTDRVGSYEVDGFPTGTYLVEVDGLREEVSVGAGGMRRDFDLTQGR